MAQLKEATKAKYREFADLHRGGPDGLRNNAKACYQYQHPKAAPKTCEAIGSQILNHPYTQEYLQAKAEKAAENADVNQTRVLKEITRIGLFDPRRLFDNVGNPLPITELDDDVAAAISGLKVTQIGGKDGEEGIGSVIEYKLSDENSALEKLMKYLGAYEKDNAQRSRSLAELLEEVRNNE